jgi:hypothetical protein
MKTDHLIAALVADSSVKERPLFKATMTSLAAALVLVSIGFVIWLPIRSDLGTPWATLAIAVKFMASMILAVCGTRLAMALSEPGRKIRPECLAILAAPGLVLLALSIELMVEGFGDWQHRLVGMKQIACLILVPALSLMPLTALLLAMRTGATTRPIVTGTVCGLAAAGMGAMFYSLVCTDDSMLFVMTWYGLAAIIVAAIGAIGGKMLLKW